MGVDGGLVVRNQDEEARQQLLYTLGGVHIVAVMEQMVGLAFVASLGSEHDVAGAAVKMCVMRLHVEESLGIAEFTAAAAINPLAQRTLVVAANDASIEILATAAVDISIEAHLPFHVRVDRRLEIEAGNFCAALDSYTLRTFPCRRSLLLLALGEPVDQTHLHFLLGVFCR